MKSLQSNSYYTSKVTGRQRGLQWKLQTGYRALSLQHTSYLCVLLLCCTSCMCAALMWGQLYFSSSSVVSRAFSVHAHAMCVFDIRASSSPLGYPCAKFRCCHDPHCWASLWRKIVYSINQSLTHSLSHSPAYLIRQVTKLSLRKTEISTVVEWQWKECMSMLLLLMQKLLRGFRTVFKLTTQKQIYSKFL